jgi:hypothetical protein
MTYVHVSKWLIRKGEFYKSAQFVHEKMFMAVGSSTIQGEHNDGSRDAANAGHKVFAAPTRAYGVFIHLRPAYRNMPT